MTRAKSRFEDAQGLRPDRQHPWRHENTGRLLLMSLAGWQDALVSGLQAQGFRRFRASHMNLLRHLDFGGTRISELAARSRLSKQAVGQLLAACEAERLVSMAPDPTDGRAKLVVFTDRGRAIIEAEVHVMRRIDAELKKLLGVRRYAELRRSLATLSRWRGSAAAVRPIALRPARRD